MTTLQSNYEKLDPSAQKEVDDFIKSLLMKKQKPFDMAEYKKRIADIPVWSDEDIKPIEEAAKHFNWKVEEW